MDTDKAYIFGLIIGGGRFGNVEDYFKIRLPYRQWGSYLKNPQRATDIQRDISQFVGPLMLSIYNLRVVFETNNNSWDIICEGDLSELKADLEKYGITCEGEIRSELPIKGIIPYLRDPHIKRRFIAGLADSIGSTNPNHRRFSNEIPILSFELKGFNFNSVCELCQLLYSVNCIPDQILWNHPNFHTSNNPYDRKWNKGFKLRVRLDQYAYFGAFAFKTKADSAKDNVSLQSQPHIANICDEKDVPVTVTAIHPGEKDSRLPKCIRNGHYIHNRHICAVLGCAHAPYAKLEAEFKNIGYLINPFPILCKDTAEKIKTILNNDILLYNASYKAIEMKISKLFKLYKSNHKTLLFSTDETNGYPIAKILQATAYIIASPNMLRGKRPKGKFIDIIKKCLDNSPERNIVLNVPNIMIPLTIFENDKGAMIGPQNPRVYSKLVTRDTENKFKLLTRPITLNDLK